MNADQKEKIVTQHWGLKKKKNQIYSSKPDEHLAQPKQNAKSK